MAYLRGLVSVCEGCPDRTGSAFGFAEVCVLKDVIASESTSVIRLLISDEVIFGFAGVFVFVINRPRQRYRQGTKCHTAGGSSSELFPRPNLLLGVAGGLKIVDASDRRVSSAMFLLLYIHRESVVVTGPPHKKNRPTMFLSLFSSLEDDFLRTVHSALPATVLNLSP